MNAVRARLEESGLDYDLRQLVRGLDRPEDLMGAAEADCRRPHRDRPCAAAGRSAS